jgi:diguanylate cyclase (GGDEF)-like protein
MVANIASTAAAPAHRWVAAGMALLLLLIAVFAATEPISLPVIPAFQEMVAASVGLSGAVIAFLLFGQFMLSGVPSLALLAVCYLFGALMSVAYALIVQGMTPGASDFLADSGSAVWLWSFRHVGQLVLLIAFAAVQVRFPGPVAVGRRNTAQSLSMVLATGLGVMALTLLATVGLPLLPALTGPIGEHLADFVLVTDLVGLGLFVAIARLRTLLQLWLALALLAAAIEALLLPQAPPFSLSWYWAGLNGLFAGAGILFVVCHEMTVLYGRLDELNGRLEQLASIDRLTNLANRRQFDQRLALEWRRARRDRAAISVAMIDIDWFKLFNDTYGHLQGDQCIRRVAAAIAGCARRPTDLAARYGGEEFAVIMATGEAEAEQLAQRIATAVRAERISHEKNAATGLVTVSIGVATYQPRLGDHRSWLVEAADNALYAAKEAGRDRVMTGKVVPGIVPGVLAERMGDNEDPDETGMAEFG